MSAIGSLSKQTFASLRNPNYRLYFGGQAISLVGTWMQRVAQSWLVLQLTGSGIALGVVAALQTLPMLVLGPYGGVVADRIDKRKLMSVLQAAMGILALGLGILTVTHTVELWHVYALAFLVGMVSCFESPTRQSFVLEIVGPEDLRNAVSLNSVLVNVARAVGPAVAGIIISIGGLGVCFLINAASFIAVVTSLLRLDVSELQPSTPTLRTKGQLREGLVYVWNTATLRVPLLMMALVGCLAYEFTVVLPVMAERTFHGDARTFGFMTAAMGAGAVVGGLFVAARGQTGTRTIINSAGVLGMAMLAAALAPTLRLELIMLAVVGASSIGFLARGNSTLQLTATPQMRGRVMALWSVAFLGSTPIGAPITGLVIEQLGARAGLLLGAIACFVAAAFGAISLRRSLSDATVTTAHPVNR